MSQPGIIERLRAQIDALGGGCDANGGGLHSAMGNGKDTFCPDCGLMLKRVAYVLPHIKPAEARAALENTRTPEAATTIAKLVRDGAALLEASERHIFGDECKAERDAFRAALEAVNGR